jgi:hypothetical protein
LNILDLIFSIWAVWVSYERESFCGRKQGAEKADAFGFDGSNQNIDAGGVATRAGEARNQAEPHRVCTGTEQQRNVPADSSDGQGCSWTTRRYNKSDTAAHKLRCNGREALSVIVGKAVFDFHIAAFDITGSIQTFSKVGSESFRCALGLATEKSDHWYRRLLRPRSERPRRRDRNPRDELSASHQRSPTAGLAAYRGGR